MTGLLQDFEQCFLIFATCLNNRILSDEDLKEIKDFAVDWSLLNGMIFKPNITSEADRFQARCAPFTLFPSIMPRIMLCQAKNLMEEFNILMYRVAQDHEYLHQCLAGVIAVDPFIRKLWDIHCTVMQDEHAQPISLDLFRSDFMITVQNASQMSSTASIPPSSSLRLIQIEFNTIAASFSGLISRTVFLHRHILELVGKPCNTEELPDNDPSLAFANGLVKAWEMYGNINAKLLFVIMEDESNVIDQRWLEFNIHALNQKAVVVRYTLLDIYQKGFLSEDKLLFVGDSEIAVSYMRAGYGEESYPSDKEWDARLMIERSRAIKCPTVRSQLSGCKKVQQELARPGAVSRFIKDPALAHRIRRTFAGLYSLSKGPDGDKNLQMALNEPQMFVLKPQREGGGHNFYGNEIVDVLTATGRDSGRESYILMERVFPLVQRNYLIKGLDDLNLKDVVSELGIYGVHIGEGERTLFNAQCGHMMRTKPHNVNEGGIMVGVAALDTPLVVDV